MKSQLMVNSNELNLNPFAEASVPNSSSHEVKGRVNVLEIFIKHHEMQAMPDRIRTLPVQIDEKVL